MLAMLVGIFFFLLAGAAFCFLPLLGYGFATGFAEEGQRVPGRRKALGWLVAIAITFGIGYIIYLFVSPISKTEELTYSEFKLKSLQDNQAFLIHGTRYRTDGHTYMTYNFMKDMGGYYEPGDSGECQVKIIPTEKGQKPFLRIYKHVPINKYRGISDWYYRWCMTSDSYYTGEYYTYDFYVPDGSIKEEFNVDSQ